MTGVPKGVVPVTQADRLIAWEHRPHAYCADAYDPWMAGRYDNIRVIQDFARHRLAALADQRGERGGVGLREALEQSLTAELADSYDCQRVWSAWDVGTMDEGDFVPVTDRIGDIVDSTLAALASSAPECGVPDGWVLVPIEPTPEMIAAWWRQKNCGSQDISVRFGEGDKFSDYDAYAALLAARPSPSGDRT